MVELKKVLSEGLKNRKPNTAMEMIVSDVLKRNGIEDGQLKNLSSEQKEKIRKIFSDLRSNIEDLLQ